MKNPKARVALLLLSTFLAAAAPGLAQEEPPAPPPTTPVAEAVKLYKAGLYQEAIDAFIFVSNKAKNKGERAKAQTYLGYTYYTIGNKEEAERAIKNAIVTKMDTSLTDKDLFSEIEGFVPDFVTFFKDIKSTTVGTVFIESVPSGATVYIDNVKTGKTPLATELAYQRYTLKFVKGGYEAQKMNLDFKKTDLGNVKLNLNEGRKNWKGFLQAALLMAGFSFLIGSI